MPMPTSSAACWAPQRSRTGARWSRIASAMRTARTAGSRQGSGALKTTRTRAPAHDSRLPPTGRSADPGPAITRYSKGYKIRYRIYYPDGSDRVALAYRAGKRDAEQVQGQASQLESITRQNALSLETATPFQHWRLL